MNHLRNGDDGCTRNGTGGDFFGSYSVRMWLVIPEILGALVLMHRSPLMGLNNALFVNWKAPSDQSIIGFLSTDPFLRECRHFRYCHQLCLLQSWQRIMFAGSGGCVVILSLG